LGEEPNDVVLMRSRSDTAQVKAITFPAALLLSLPLIPSYHGTSFSLRRSSLNGGDPATTLLLEPSTRKCVCGPARSDVPASSPPSLLTGNVIPFISVVMAHPITQLPPSTLPFCLPARTTTSLGFSFGDFGSHHYPLPPLRHEVEPAPIKTRSSYGTEAVPSSSTLKRARRSRSPSSTSSPSHIQSSPILEKFGDSSISRLSPERRIGGNHRVKRLRQTYASLEDASDTSAVDVGLLLCTSASSSTTYLTCIQLLCRRPVIYRSCSSFCANNRLCTLQFSKKSRVLISVNAWHRSTSA